MSDHLVCGYKYYFTESYHVSDNALYYPCYKNYEFSHCDINITVFKIVYMSIYIMATSDINVTTG